MPATKKPSKAWKAFERRVAAYWGCLRNRLSGSSGREDCEPSDTTHLRLHVECKLHQKQAVWREWDKAKKASKGKKTVVLALGSPHRPGWITAFHSDDTARFVYEWLMNMAECNVPSERRDVIIMAASVLFGELERREKQEDSQDN